MQRAELELHAGGEGAGTRCDVFLVRHAQRIDETDEGPRWRAQNADRWFDPPLTDAGKRQSAAAAAQLVRYAKACDAVPFSCVYCSPLLRTLQTAVEFGRALGLPVVPVAGLATCTAAFKKHGGLACSLLPIEAARRHCDRDVVIDAYSAEYPSAGRGDTDLFRLTCERIAAAECDRGAGGSVRPAAALVVAHREGLRDMSVVARREFRRTAYCSCAVFSYCSAATGSEGARAGSAPGGSGHEDARGSSSGAPSSSGCASGRGPCRWSLRLDPAEYDARVRGAALAAADATPRAAAAEADKVDEGAARVVDWLAEGEESTAVPSAQH